MWVCALCRYNLRVVECRLAAMLLAVALGKPASEAVSITTLKEVEPLIIDKYGLGAEAQDKAVREHLHEGVYMPEEVGGWGRDTGRKRRDAWWHTCSGQGLRVCVPLRLMGSEAVALTLLQLTVLRSSGAGPSGGAGTLAA